MSKKTLETTDTPLLFGTIMSKHKIAILPKGITMEYDNSYSEGFSRYIVRVKVKGEFKRTIENDDWISPIWIQNVDKDDIIDIISYHPINKSDLFSMIKESKISRSELIDILRHWDEN